MARIKIKDLPVDMKISKDEMKKIRGGNVERLRLLSSNPWVLAGTVATAIAVPVAIHNNSNSAPSSP